MPGTKNRATKPKQTQTKQMKNISALLLAATAFVLIAGCASSDNNFDDSKVS